MKASQNQTRVYGLDLIRLLSFAAIFLHHYTWVGWYTVENPFHDSNWISPAWEFLSRALCFSGHTILMMSIFLISIKPLILRRRLWLLGFLLVGWMLFSLMLWGESPFWMEWDIYPLIVLGLGLMTFFEMCHRSLVYAAGIAGFALLWIPFWDWPSLNERSLLWRHLLIGDCIQDLAEWPILPWIGIIFAPYAVGYYLKNRKYPLIPNGKMSPWEIPLWVGLLGYSFRYLGKFYEVPLGDQFSCFIFRRPFVEMFFHLIWIVFLMRLSFLRRVQNYLHTNRINLWISSLAISRRFWLAYFIHYMSLYIFVWPYGKFMLNHPWTVDAELIAYPFILEFLTRSAERWLLSRGWYGKT